MTDKEKLDAIRAEIHRLVDVRGYDREMANDLFAFIGSLPNEPVSEGLEEAANKYSSCAYLEEVLSDDDKEVLKDRLKNTFKAGVEWHKNTKRSNENLDEAAWLYYDRNKPITPPELVLHKEFISFFKAGTNWKKQQIMKDAIDAKVGFRFHRLSIDLKDNGIEVFKNGDKVKILILKQEDE